MTGVDRRSAISPRATSVAGEIPALLARDPTGKTMFLGKVAGGISAGAANFEAPFLSSILRD